MGIGLSRKTLATAGRWTAWLSAGCLALALAAFAAVQTPWAKRLLADAAAQYCAHELGWRLTLSTPEGMLPFTVRIASLRIEDQDGEWLAASDAALSLAPWPVGRGLASVRLTVGRAAVRRAPVLPPDQSSPAPAARPLAFLDELSPIPVEAEALVELDGLQLDSPLAGKALDGRVSLRALALGGAVDATLAATARETRPDAPSPATNLSAKARLDPGARTLRLKLALEEEPGGLAATAGLAPDQPLALSLEGDGSLAAWQAKLAARTGREEILSGTLAAGLGPTSADDARASLDLAVNPSLLPLPANARDALGARAELAFKGRMTSAGLPEPQWRILAEELSVSAEAFKASVRGDSGPLGLAPRLTFSVRVADPASLGLDAGPMALEGGLDADVDPAGPLSAGVRLSSPDLGPALAPLGVGLGGKADLSATLTGDARTKDFAVRLDAGLTELVALSQGKADLGSRLAAALGREVRLTAEAGLSGGTRVTLAGLTARARAARVEASGTFDTATRQAEARAHVDAPDLAALAPLAGMTLGGALTLQASIAGAVDAPQATLAVEGKALAVDSTRLDRASLRLEAAPAREGVAGKLDVRADKGNGRLAASAAFALAGQRLALTNLQASGPGLALSASLDAALDHKTASGRLKTSADLAPLGAFLGRKMAGRLQAEAALASQGPRQDVTARLEATALSAEGVGLKKAELSGSLGDVLRAPQGDMTLALGGLAAGGAAVESLQAKAHGNGNGIAFNASAKGTHPERFGVAAGGQFTPAPGGGALRLDTLEATARDLRLALVRPATAAYGPDAMSLDGLHLSLDGAALTASGALRHGRVDFSADVAALPLALLEKAGLPALAGTANASLRATGAAQAPRVSLKLDLGQVVLGDAKGRNVPPASLTAEALLEGGRLSASSRLSAGPGAAFDMKGSLPARLSLKPFSFAAPRDATLDAALTGDVDLARVAALTGDEALTLKGTLKADFTVSGRLSAPLVSGRASLADGQADYVATGTRLRDITLDLEASGSKAVLKAFTARDAGQGSLSATGTADISPAAGFPFEASLTVDRLTPLRTDMATAMLSAKVDASGGAGGATVRGGVHVGPVDVNIPERMPPSATPIPVEMAGAAGRAKAGPAAEARPYPVDLDVAVDFPGRIFVRGMGLDSQWAGNLRVKGTPGEPEIGGGIRVVRGQLDFFGKSFNLARGEVTFHGAKPPVPMLDMEARTQTGDLTASILVTGSAARPTIDFTSDPAVPRDEILARVLFGQSVSSLTPPQALQLAQAVASLGGAGGSLDFLGATRRLAGLDYLGVKSSGQSLGQSAVAAGKYVADGVYVEASQGLAGASGAVSVEVDVTRNISIESRIGLDAKTGVGVNWKFDY